MAKLFANFKSFLKSEDGDTNFISIIIILGVVIVLAGVFVAFKDKIIGTIDGIVNGFSASSLGKGSNGSYVVGGG